MFLKNQRQKWSGIPPTLRWMLVEAMCTLAVTRILVAFGLKWCMPWVLRPLHPQDAVESPSYEFVQEMRFALFVGSHNVPWESVCLPTAMAGKWMLQRRGWASRIHLGVGKQDSGDMYAHAWLELCGYVIAGADGISSVVPLPIYVPASH